jgi:hypothetical protein
MNIYLNKYFITVVYSLLLANLLSLKNVQGQDKVNGHEFSIRTTDSINRIYGFDPLLYNGKVYSDFFDKSIVGNQYLIESDFSKGEIVIKGIKYRNININYDIYNQHLLLKFEDVNGAKRILIISKAWLNGFTIDNRVFEKIDSLKPDQQLYQVIGKGSVRVVYFWKKELKTSNVSGDAYYFFSAPVKELFVSINNQFKKYKNNRTFILAFEPKKQGLIKRYIRQNKIRLKWASDQVILNLVQYCNNI